MVNVWKLAIEDTYSLFGKHLSDDVEKLVDKCKKKIQKYSGMSDEQLSEHNTSTNIISSNINEQNENITTTKADTFFGPLCLILAVILTILVILVSKEKSVIGIFGVVPLIFGIITREKSLYNKDKAIIGMVLGLATIIIGFIKFLTVF